MTTSEQYGWRFTERDTDADVIVVGGGHPEFWTRYGEVVTIVSWSLATGSGCAGGNP